MHASIQELCCRGKLLQQECGDLLTDRQQELLYTEVFGKLGNVQRRANCGFVPALGRDWFPADLPAEIAHCQKIVRAAPPAATATSAPGDAPLVPLVPAAETLPARDRERLHKAEQMMLAEVYRE
ncbi:MAG: hypothetical protein FJ265_22190, partial [Planctomycetes bacterium]|nr:hypothetical protein [Planctomycetota bacterium]